MNDDDAFPDFPAGFEPPPPPVRKRRTTAAPPYPVASFACWCGFRDEVKEPAPRVLDCPDCRTIEGLKRVVPRYLPPIKGGRELTAIERRGIELDTR